MAMWPGHNTTKITKKQAWAELRCEEAFSSESPHQNLSFSNKDEITKSSRSVSVSLEEQDIDSECATHLLAIVSFLFVTFDFFLDILAFYCSAMIPIEQLSKSKIV